MDFLGQDAKITFLFLKKTLKNATAKTSDNFF